MKITNIFKKLTSATAAAALFMTALPSMGSLGTAEAASAVSIDTNKTYQTIKGFGGINLPEWAGSDMTSEQVATAFGNGDDQLGLSILRVYVSDDSNAWSKAVPTAKAATAYGATIFASPWNPPTSMRETFTRNGVANQRRLAKSSYGAYAKHLNSYIKYMKEQGIDIYSMSIQNEPDYGAEWTWWTADECVDFIANYGKDVVSGTDTKLMSPETFQYNKDYYNAILKNSAANANVDIFGTHFYGTQRSQMDFPALENDPRDIWMTEVYVPNSEANSQDRWPEAVQVAENIHNGFVVGNMNAYVWWFIRRNYSPMKEDGTISKRGYCMAQYSKYVRPGDVRIDATESPQDNILVSAYKNNSDQVTIVAVNKGNSEVTQEFSMKNGESISDVDRYRTTSTENIAETADMDHKTSSFFSQLPANSVSTFVVSLGGSSNITPTDDPVVTPPASNDGYIFHDTFESSADSWEGRGAATVSRTNGTLSCEGRTASWNGASKNLSTSDFVPGKEYSFSVNAMHNGTGTETFKLTLQYTDASGTANYPNIAKVDAAPGEWVTLSNTSFLIPSDAADLVLYVETDETMTDFVIDEAVAASGGTVIGAAGGSGILGDVNGDGVVDVFDVISGRQALIKGAYSKGGDVDMSGKFEINDLVQIQKFVLASTNKWPTPVTTTTTKPVTTTTTTVAGSSKWDSYKETASADWINFYKSSIKNMGDTSRISAKLTAAENGSPLTIAYLGGSITEGKNYSSPFSNYVKNTFAKGGFTEVNAGMSGTSSVVGLVRSERDIFSKKPDIVFLEFSVNDHEDISYKKSFESLVKKILDQPQEPAVVILINRSKGGFSTQAQMAPIGQNANVAVISMDDALTKAFNSGFLQTGDYFNDEYHPHAKGGQLVADCLAYYFRQAMKSENATPAYTYPNKTVYGNEYSTCINADPSTDLKNFNAGSFSAGKGYGSLPYGYDNSKSGNTPMTFKADGKGLIIVFKANSTGMGAINVTVNGKTTKVNGNKQYTWGGPDAEVAFYDANATSLDVSIQMDNAGADFSIWGIGLIK
ncbi:MAG: carbohydrate binding domain-containing protein [Ruminococcus sp.]|nr:carbohydrate binding domain-containing protein [Ruminococcus sp.]